MEYLYRAFYYFEMGGFISFAIFIIALFSYYLSFYTLFALIKYNKICKVKKIFFKEYELAFSANENLDEIKSNFTKLRLKILDKIDTRLKFALSLATVSPLLGLLGTISGLGMSLGGISHSTQSIAEGISKALITTQAGLSVAIPVLIFVLIARSYKQKILVNISKYEIYLLRKAVVK